MKQLLAIALFFPLFSMAQECQLHKDVDPYTKDKTLSTGFIQLDGGSVTIDANSTEIDVLFTMATDGRCFDNLSTAEVFFEGIKTKMTARNDGTMNCEGLFHFIFRNNRSSPVPLLKRMTTNKMTEIVFIGSDKKKTKTTITLNPEQQQVMQKLATCLLNEAKTLIK